MDRASPSLPLPDEPAPLRAALRALVEQLPVEGERLLAAGDWIAAPLWQCWHAALEPRGLDLPAFRAIVAGYRNELRLWVMGERPWSHCVAGLAGRIDRRLPALDTSALPATAKPRSRPRSPNGRSLPVAAGRDAVAWRDALRRAGLPATADLATVATKLAALRLLYEVEVRPTTASGSSPTTSYAIVWSGARPRDPEVPFAEATTPGPAEHALAEALGRFLLKDPAYPLNP